MEPKPPQVCYLAKGKAIGAKSHEGFPATFNWLLSWIVNLMVGPGLALRNADKGRPRLELLIKAGNGIEVQPSSAGAPVVISSTGGAMIGNTLGSVPVSGAVQFASTADSCVEVTTANVSDTPTVTIGVYYT